MKTGKVYLVGAGPGDPGLITVAGLERIKEADVIVYDRLIGNELLDHARPDAELVYVGKIPGPSQIQDQQAINDLLVEKARAGYRVVRLKGGDPFVFGRGGEEAEALSAAGIPFEVVPGVTSAVAVPAYGGIPVTHRGVSQSFAVITGHDAPDTQADHRSGVASALHADTLVFLMGVKNLPDITKQLVANGRAPDTPVAVIQQGTSAEQRTVTGTLTDIVDVVEKAGIKPPAVTVVGEVVRLRKNLAWFAETGGRLAENRPLYGKRVLITRTRRQASILARLLAAEGAIPVELPTIEIAPLCDGAALKAAIERLRDGAYAWTGFTSANAVEVFFDALSAAGLDARAFGPSRVFAIGPATARALAEHGITADVVPDEYFAEAIVAALRPHLSNGERVFLPRAESAREELVQGLETLGASLDEVPLYRTLTPVDPPPEPIAMLRNGEIDIVTFTSSSTVRNLAEMLGGTELLERPLIACIGPITADTARELGLRVDVMAAEYTVEGLVEALTRRIDD